MKRSTILEWGTAILLLGSGPVTLYTAGLASEIKLMSFPAPTTPQTIDVVATPEKPNFFWAIVLLGIGQSALGFYQLMWVTIQFCRSSVSEDEMADPDPLLLEDHAEHAPLPIKITASQPQSQSHD